MSRILWPGILSQHHAVPLGPPQVLDLPLSALSDTGMAVAWASDTAGTNWPEFITGVDENVLYIGANQNGWWNNTGWFRWPLPIEPGALFTRARIQFHMVGRGAGITGGYNFTAQVGATQEDNAPVLANGAQATAWLNSGRANIGSFPVGPSLPVANDVTFWVELDPAHFTTLLARPGWVADQYAALSIQEVPPNQPTVGEGTVGRWATVGTGRGSAPGPRLLLEFNGYLSS